MGGCKCELRLLDDLSTLLSQLAGSWSLFLLSTSFQHGSFLSASPVGPVTASGVGHEQEQLLKHCRLLDEAMHRHVIVKETRCNVSFKA